jgi:formylglycine-generating enzyme required for sulfatase activity
MKIGKRAFSPRAFVAIAAIIAAGFIVTGCSDADTETSVAVTKVTLNKKEIYLPVGENETLSAAVQAADKTVSWSSSKEAVATVSGGTVTGVADGIAIITVSTKDGGTADCLVIVGTGAGSVELNRSTLILETGKTETLSVTVLPNVLSKDISWSSSAPTVATVSGGTVTALALGKATITVTTAAGGGSAICNVTVISVPTGMAWIPAGTFMMGSPITEPQSYEDEDLHQVTLTQGFFMGKYEVTQGLYEELMGYNPSYFYNNGQDQDFYDDDYYIEGWKDYPVDFITWFDAVEFCNKLSVKEGLTPAYTMNNRQPPTGYPIDGVDWNIGEIVTTVTCNWGATGYRLPTEAEWEYACRAGTTTPFNTGNSISSGLEGQANFDGIYEPYNGAPEGEYLGYPTPVGGYAPNAYGLYDMHGNVGEWCWDWYMSYRRTASGQTETDPKGPEGDWHKVWRGGSWFDQGTKLRSAYRSHYGPGDNWFLSFCLGFRVVRPYSEE